jgi:hypothetical protein
LSLREDEDLIIHPTDKGRATVIMSTKDYCGKMKELFSESTYKVIKKDPASKTGKLQNLSDGIRRCYQQVNPYSF